MQVTKVEFPSDKRVAPSSSQTQIGDGLGLSSRTIAENAIICAWYKPARTAKLFYAGNKRADAKWAERRLRGKFIDGCKIKVHYSDSKKIPRDRFKKPHGCKAPKRSQVRTVVISNLSAATKASDIAGILGPRHKYAALKMGTVKSLGLEETSSKVRDWLNASENDWKDLRRFDPLPDVDSLMMKVIVEFGEVQLARGAVKKGKALCHGVLGGLFLYPRCSVKFNVLPSILHAIQADFNDLVMSSWQREQVHIRSYLLSNPLGKFQEVRIYGQDQEAVMNTKAAFQNPIDGTPAMDGNAMVWDDFFSTIAGLKYLQELYTGKDTYIFRDNRRRRLVLYGPREAKLQTQEDLVKKTKDLLTYSHVMKPKEEELSGCKWRPGRALLDLQGIQ
jgi:hypothetical protein